MRDDPAFINPERTDIIEQTKSITETGPELPEPKYSTK
jgi:hypothetical protein